MVDGVHTQESSGYCILSTNALIQYQGRVVFLYPLLECFQVGSHQFHSPNVDSWQMVSRGKRWFVMGFYLAPNDASTIDHVVTAISRIPLGAALLMDGNANSDMAKP